ncbi:MAG: erythromycin esterase family protein [Saprospiraceae bacterium]|nr:erythromycin esterase family protein [Saprospiraceae bacterium]
MLVEILSEDDRALNMCFETDFANTAIINAMLKSGCSQEEIMSIVWANGSWPFYTKEFLGLVTYFNNCQKSGHIFGFHKSKNTSIERLKNYVEKKSPWCGSSTPKEEVLQEAIQWTEVEEENNDFHKWEKEKANLIHDHLKPGERLLINAHNAHLSKYGISFGHRLYLIEPDQYYNIAYSFRKGSFWAKSTYQMNIEQISAQTQFSAEYISNTTNAFVFDIRAFRNSPKFTKWKDHLVSMIDVGAVLRTPAGEYNNLKLLQNYDLLICANEESPSTKYKD